MALDRKKMMRFYKVTVYFKTGVKTYKMSYEKFKPFMVEMKKRKDVIKYTYENIYSYVN